MKESKSVLISVLVFLTFIFTLNAVCQETQQTRPFYMGFTPFPWDISLEAVSSTNRFIVENGDIISHHLDAGVPWSEALENKPFHKNLKNDWANRKKYSANAKIFVSVTPLNNGRNGMALYRGKDENMPLPASFQNKPFDDPIVQKAYLNYCRRVIERFQPDYLAIGIEINELFHHSPAEWEPFTVLYKETYKTLKKGNPDLPIFATVSLHNLTNPGWKDRETQQEKIKELLPYMDIVGISYYSFMSGGPKQSEKPTEAFDWLKEFTSKPIAFTETGYTAETIVLKTYNVTIPSAPSKQKIYYETLLDRALQDKYLFVISYLYRDYDALWDKIKSMSPEAFIVWKDCGFFDEANQERPAFGVWKRYFSMKKSND